VEAGLRSGRLDAPFPEEFNRRAVAVATWLHFAPTSGAARQLGQEGVQPANVVVTGNTIVDAVLAIRGTGRRRETRQGELPLVVVTFHRRESFGEAARNVLGAIRELVLERSGRVRVVYPVHPNPSIGAHAREILGGVEGVDLRAPMITRSSSISVPRPASCCRTQAASRKKRPP
jgi:UDP-N-acetylglucosamine 2-epimerase (non-hydrolysing)